MLAINNQKIQTFYKQITLQHSLQVPKPKIKLTFKLRKSKTQNNCCNSKV